MLSQNYILLKKNYVSNCIKLHWFLSLVSIWMFMESLQCWTIPERVRTYWTDKICLTLRKFSTKFVSAKLPICQAWANWDRYLLTASVNHKEINTIACTLFTGKVTWDLRSHGLMVIFHHFDRIRCLGRIYYCLHFSFFFLEFVRLQQRQRDYAASRGTNLPCSSFDCRANTK